MYPQLQAFNSRWEAVEPRTRNSRKDTVELCQDTLSRDKSKSEGFSINRKAEGILIIDHHRCQRMKGELESSMLSVSESREVVAEMPSLLNLPGPFIHIRIY